jgi:hypothetical protein
MNESTQTMLKIAGMVVVGIIAWKVLAVVTALAFKILIPAIVIGGILYVVYRANGGKALGGGRRTLP